MIKYEVQGKIGVVTGTTKQEMNLVIPNVLDGYPISKIEGNSFQEQARLRKVEIPGSVKVIGAYSFASCPNLKEVVLQEGVEVIEDWAFCNCSIETIKLPSTIKSIGDNAFMGNMCKYDIEKFIKEKDHGKRQRNHTNNRCSVFPLALLEAKDNINNDIIESRSKYIDSQFDMVEAGGMTQAQLDIPFIFNGDVFLLAYFSKKEATNITFDIASESKTQIGLYSDNDPDFLVLKVNVMQGDALLSSFYIKTPYLEDVKVQNMAVEHVEKDGTHYYFVTVRVKMKCFGNGNISREFALNLFNDFTGKYQTELANGLINQSQFDTIKDDIDEKIMEVMDGFLTQIDGAPIYTYSINLQRYILNDESVSQDVKTLINNKIFERTLKYYNELTDVESLEKICFVDVYDTLNFITTATGMSLEELNQKYDLSITNEMGATITEEEAKSYQNIFSDLETNYNLHADFILYIFKELQRLNNIYSVQAFSA